MAEKFPIQVSTIDHFGSSHYWNLVMQEKIRVGILLDSFEAPAWVVRMVKRINESSHSNVVLIVLNQKAGEKYAVPQKKLVSLPRRAAHKAFDKIFYSLVQRHSELPDALKPEDIRPEISGVQIIPVVPVRTQWSDKISEPDLDLIRTHEVDVFLRCGFRILRGGILKVARQGIWSFHHGDNRINRGGPPCFWETMEDVSVTGSILQIITEDLDNGLVISRSWSRTDRFSVQDNRSGVYWKSLQFVVRSLRELHRKGPERFMLDVRSRNESPSFYSEKLYTKPSTSEWGKLVAKKVLQKLGVLWENCLYQRQWQLRFTLGDPPGTSFYRYKSIIPPADRFWADPHIIKREDKYYVFIEEYLYSTGKGHVSVMIMDEDGNHSDPVPVLERPYHLSYPFVFEHEGRIFMIPESAADGTVQLYECTCFPDKWEWRINLMEDVRAVDATLHHDGKLWWMFVNMAVEPEAATSDELYIFYAENLITNDWKAHTMNPVVSDCRSSRPAGPLFIENGQLYRPSQNCSKRYGYGFHVNRILTLTPTDFKEETVSSVLPHWEKDLLGTHTYVREGRLGMIDVQVRRRKR